MGWPTCKGCLFAYYTSSNFDILNAVALLDHKVPIRLKPDWIQSPVCVIVRWLINRVYHKIQGGHEVLKSVELNICSCPPWKGRLPISEWGVYLKRGLNISVNSKTSNLLPGIPEVFDWSFALCSLSKQPFFPATCSCKFHEEELLRRSNKKILNDDGKSVLELGQKHWLLDRADRIDTNYLILSIDIDRSIGFLIIEFHRLDAQVL